MRLDERLRVAACFGLLGLGAIGVGVRLANLQVVPEGSVLRMARAQERRVDRLPAPRGRVVDRDGRPLAWDRPVFEARAEFKLRAIEREPGAPDAQVRSVRDFDGARRAFVDDLTWALGKDPIVAAEPTSLDLLRAALDRRVLALLERDREKLRDAYSGDILIARGLDSADVTFALRDLDYRSGTARGRRGGRVGKARYTVAVHLLRRYERVYPRRELTWGIVGHVQPGPGPNGDDRVPMSGLERLELLTPRARGERASRVRAGGQRYWCAEETLPESAVDLRTTLDLGLQAFADEQLMAAVAGVTAHYETPPEWGSVVLVDVRDGGILAMCSYSAAEDGGRELHGSFAPTQRLFEPGSVVKPLHVALALERGRIRWDREIDCSPGYRAGSEFARGLPGRVIRDSHACGMLTPHGILVQSSNIGAVRLGLQLGAEGIEDYLALYRLGESVGLPIPGEAAGRRPRGIPQMRRNERLVYSGPSVCFGYQMHVTGVQVARAFASLLSGRSRDLRLVDGLVVDGELHRHRARPVAPRFLSDRTIATVKAALVDVVDDEHGTARRLGAMLRKAGVPAGTVGGKTGTSEYHPRSVKQWDGKVVAKSVRTATFVGFAPVDAPRYLAVMVVQKVGASKFYGGLYAASAVGRLLLRALEGERSESGGPELMRSGLAERR